MCDQCKGCQKPVTADEAAMTKKLINRGTTEWLCYGCMSEHFSVTVELLREKVEQFREMGCTLFEPERQ